jgi:hypothetical protein
MTEKALFISLGGSCIAALQLRRRGLRVCSLPFDWLFHVDNTMWSSLSEGFANDFIDWMFFENMKELSIEERGTSNLFQYKDLKTGYRFIHDFHKPISNSKEYRKVVKKYRRRFSRLYRLIDDADQVHFIANTKWSVDLNLIKTFMDVVSKKWDEKRFHLYVVNFRDKENAIIYDNSITVYKFTRCENKYDYFETNIEWDFLDVFLNEKKRNKYVSLKIKNKEIHLNLFNMKMPIVKIQIGLFGYIVEFSLGIV